MRSYSASERTHALAANSGGGGNRRFSRRTDSITLLSGRAWAVWSWASVGILVRPSPWGIANWRRECMRIAAESEATPSLCELATVGQARIAAEPSPQHDQVPFGRFSI